MHLTGLLTGVLAALLTACADRAGLAGLDGQSRALGDVVGRGHWVMLNVWSPGCPHCLDELPTLIEFHADNPHDATVVGIAVDYPGFGYPDRDALATFVAGHAITFPILMADGEQAGEFVGDTVDLVPTTFAFDPAGRMVARWHGVITRADIDEIINDFSGNGP